MCGIAGVAAADGRPVDRALVAAMTRTLAHRGPDGEGFHFAPGIGLGHRRLAIVDLSDAGRQPLSNEDGSVWVSFNGEIYNFPELRRVLEAKGHRFRSHTDGEVLVHLYEERGADLVEELRGMFAFALWDERARRLLLARDRLGIKPLFYAEHRGELRFGSEIKAILADPDVSREIDPVALDGYLAQNYVAAPATLLGAVRQLEPGELLVFEQGHARRRHYWTLRHGGGGKGSTREWTDRVEAALRDAVRSHLMADVPYGALLSGGLDSATLVGVLVQEHRAETLTFTADFAEATFGEGAQARRVAAALGAKNEQVSFGAPTLAALEAIVRHADEPTADMSMLPFDAVCRLARARVKVALSGEGADEVFAGYPTYTASLLADAYRRVPAPARAVVRRALLALPPSEGKVTLREKLQRFVRGVEVPGIAAHFAWRQICEPELRRELHRLPAARAAADDDTPPGAVAFGRHDASRPLDRLLAADLAYYLPNDMLVKADRISMAHGLELRVPYLDHPLVELAATLPPELKLRRLRHGKWVLRRVAGRVLPRAGRPPRRKLGFNVPFGTWLRGPLREAARDVLSPARIRRQGLLDPDVVARLHDEHDRRQRDRQYELYGLLVLSIWWDQIYGAASTSYTRATELPA